MTEQQAQNLYDQRTIEQLRQQIQRLSDALRIERLRVFSLKLQLEERPKARRDLTLQL